MPGPDCKRLLSVLSILPHMHFHRAAALLLPEQAALESGTLAENGDLAVQGSSAISRLPRYLTAQMVRFFYKVDTQQKAKILRKVIPNPILTAMLICPPSRLLSLHVILQHTVPYTNGPEQGAISLT